VNADQVGFANSGGVVQAQCGKIAVSGIHIVQDNVVSGIKLMAERIDGVVVATIAGE
jgi:hypothetical protein